MNNVNNGTLLNSLSSVNLIVWLHLTTCMNEYVMLLCSILELLSLVLCGLSSSPRAILVKQFLIIHYGFARVINNMNN